MKKWAALSITLVLGITLVACGERNSKFSPMEVVNAALLEVNEPLAYYGEYTMVIGDEADDYTIKEWVSKENKRRIETVATDGTEEVVSVNDGNSVSMYDQATNTVMIMEISEMINAELNNQSPREKTGALLENIKDSHDLLEGEPEEIAGRPTFHIIAKAKDEKALIGDAEIWIDKETWLPLKSITHSGKQAFILEYQKIEFDAQIKDDLFVLDIPEDATIETLVEDLPKEADLNEVKEELGIFYQVRETDELELARITVLEGLEDRKEFSFDYNKDDMNAFSVTVFKNSPNVVDFGGAISEEEIIVRGKKAAKMEMEDFRSLYWDEEGLRYSVYVENPTIEFDEVLTYLEEMVLTE